MNLRASEGRGQAFRRAETEQFQGAAEVAVLALADLGAALFLDRDPGAGELLLLAQPDPDDLARANAVANDLGHSYTAPEQALAA